MSIEFNQLNHTPTPWFATCESSQGIYKGHAIYTNAGDDKDASYLGTVSGQGVMKDEANAAIIIRAVNNHGALVSALKDILTEMEIFDPRGDGQFIEAARAALKLAEASTICKATGSNT